MKCITLLLITVCLSIVSIAQNDMSPVEKENLIGLSPSELIQIGFADESYYSTEALSGNGAFSRFLDDCNGDFIPKDNSYTAVLRNDDGSYYLSNMGFTFSFCGSSYTDVYINTNGNLSFTQAVSQFSPDGFPYSIPMIAPFWGDVDTRNTACGQIWYKLSQNSLIVTWEGVGWYNQQCSPLNTFQVIITDGTDPLIGVGNNVQFRYGDMNWTTGQASGGGPFGGFAATVGYNSGDAVNFEQIGRFNQDNSSYDGPFSDDDGVHWLDFQCFVFDAAGNSAPDISCVDITRSLDANCLVSITADEVGIASANGCYEISLDLDKNTFGCSNLGDNEVTFTAYYGLDSVSCTSTVTIVQGTCESAAILPVNPFCENDIPTGLYATPLGGTWGGAADTNGTFDPMTNGAGNHTVTYTDLNGCSTDSIIVTVFPSPKIELDELNNVSCFEEEDGSILVHATGGTQPYAFQWNNEMEGPFIDGLESGSYILALTDTLGCSDTSEFHITEPADLQITYTVNHNSCFGDSNGEILLDTDMGGTPPYQYVFEGDTSNTIIEYTGLFANEYHLEVIDSKGCVDSKNILINEPPDLQIIYSVEDVSCFGNADGAFRLDTVFGGTPPYQYVFEGDTSGAVSGYDGLLAGDYHLEILDFKGCVDSFNFIIEESPVLEIIYTVNHVSCFGDSDGEILLDIDMGGTPPYQYVFEGDTSNTMNEYDGLLADEYHLEVIDSKSCVDSINILINEPSDLQIIYSVEDVSCFGASDGAIWLDALNGGTPPYQYIFEGNPSSTGFDYVGLVAGEYHLEIIDENACVDSINILINEPPELGVLIETNDIIDLGEEITVHALVSNPYPTDITLEWTTNDCNGCVSFTDTPLYETTYHVIATDENGCIATDKLTVQVRKPVNAFIPNAFTPNGDLVNDRFKVFTGKGIEEIQAFKIFNRWGALLYEEKSLPSNEGVFGWDGTFNNKIMPVGVYVYTLEVKYIDGSSRMLTGDLALLR